MQMKGEQLPQGTYCMRDIILKMIHSGKYSPGSDWLHPTYGKGLSIDKSFCAFKMCTRPALTTKHDVDLVFFDDGRRLTPETFWHFVAGNHANECIARGGPCSTQEGWELPGPCRTLMLEVNISSDCHFGCVRHLTIILFESINLLLINTIASKLEYPPQRSPRPAAGVCASAYVSIV